MWFLITFIGAIFYPPLWFVFFGLIIWTILTGKRRRNNVLNNILNQFVQSNHDEITLKNIHWEAVCSYALDNGAKGAPHARSKYDNDYFAFDFTDSNGKTHFISFHYIRFFNEISLTRLGNYTPPDLSYLTEEDSDDNYLNEEEEKDKKEDSGINWLVLVTFFIVIMMIGVVSGGV